MIVLFFLGFLAGLTVGLLWLRFDRRRLLRQVAEWGWLL
jgi:uncharacterized membrane-anchored protein YhcB (DUF1043 family)